MKILAIETSCDETAMALVEIRDKRQETRDKDDLQFKILAEAISSQIETHRPFGGVVPHLAKREHIQNLPIMLEKIKKILNLKSLILNPDLIAVTVGPGLEPCLWTGINFAKELAKELKASLIGVSHLEGHIFSNWLENRYKIKFPIIVLLVSGGHTILVLMKSAKKWEVLGETRDDAVGEAFDKVAKILGLPYPGGPEVEKLSQNFDISKYRYIDFPCPMIYNKNYDFSFSGLKTAVLYYLRDLNVNHSERSEESKQILRHSVLQNDATRICASFQAVAINVLVHKTMRAAAEFKTKSILLCGGVASNKRLQKEFRKRLKKFPNFPIPQFHVPNSKYNGDNAVMIAAAAYLGKKYKTTKALPNLGL